MKKVLALLLALTLVAACFVGCDKKEASGDIPTLIWYVPGDSQDDIDAVMEAANKIVEKEIGARIDMKFISTGDFDEKMRLKMASGDKFDLCFTGYINAYTKAAQMGGLEPLDELLKLTPDLVAATPQFFWDAAEIDGKIYAVPNQQIVAAQKALFIHKDLVEKYNVDVDAIKEYKDLEPFFEQIKKNEPDMWAWRNRNGYFKIGADTEEIISIGIGIEKGDKENVKVIFTDELQPMIDGINLRYEWYKKGYMHPDVVSLGTDETNYLAGRYATDIQTYKPGVETNIKSVLKKDVVACKNIHEPYISMGGGTSTMIGIGKNSQHKEKAMKFIELINTNKELYNIICFGIEGKHYDLTEDGFVKTKEGSGYAPEADWKFGNQFNALVREGASKDVWEQTKAMNQEAIDKGNVSPLLGFTIDKTNIEAELSSLTSIRKQYATSYFIGVKPVDDGYWEYIDMMYDAGLEKVLKEVQNQVDDFLEEKERNSK